MDTEVVRVRQAYKHRDDSGASRRGDPFRADVIGRRAERDRAWGWAIRRCGHGLGAVVEVGCGTADPSRWAVASGAEAAVGVDLLPDRLLGARRSNPLVRLAVADGRHLPFPRHSFDTAICSTLFSSILDEDVQRHVAASVAEVVRPGGMILWLDMAVRNPRNPDVRPVSRADIRRLWPAARDVALTRVFLPPPLARKLGDRTAVLSLLSIARPLRTHLAGGIVLT